MSISRAQGGGLEIEAWVRVAGINGGQSIRLGSGTLGHRYQPFGGIVLPRLVWFHVGLAYLRLRASWCWVPGPTGHVHGQPLTELEVCTNLVQL